MQSATEINLRRVLVGHRAAVNVIDFDRRYIVSASGDRTIKVWDMSTCEFIRTLNGHKRGIACLQYKDQLIVSGSSDNSIRFGQLPLILITVLSTPGLSSITFHAQQFRWVGQSESYLISCSRKLRAVVKLSTKMVLIIFFLLLISWHRGKTQYQDVVNYLLSSVDNSLSLLILLSYLTITYVLENYALCCLITGLHVLSNGVQYLA